MRRAPRDWDAFGETSCINPSWSKQTALDWAAQEWGFSSASLDFAFAYSIRRWEGGRAEIPHNKQTREAPNADVVEPLTWEARAAWLPIQRTPERDTVVLITIAKKAVRIAARLSERKMAASPPDSWAMRANHVGRWAWPVMTRCSKTIQAIWPSPWTSGCAPIGNNANGDLRGGNDPAALYGQGRHILRAHVSLAVRERYCREMSGTIIHLPSFSAKREAQKPGRPRNFLATDGVRQLRRKAWEMWRFAWSTLR